MRLILVILAFMAVTEGCATREMTVVSTVNLDRYKGTWYEIARLPNSFEKGLICTTANYTLRKDGKITVINRGRKNGGNAVEKSSKGVAWIPDQSSPSKLKVSFFWPFSGKYWIIGLDKDYQYALIGEPSRKYLWILARQKTLDEEIYKYLLDTAIKQGYDVSQIIKVDQNCQDN